MQCHNRALKQVEFLQASCQQNVMQKSRTEDSVPSTGMQLKAIHSTMSREQATIRACWRAKVFVVYLVFDCLLQVLVSGGDTSRQVQVL